MNISAAAAYKVGEVRVKGVSTDAFTLSGDNPEGVFFISTHLGTFVSSLRQRVCICSLYR